MQRDVTTALRRWKIREDRLGERKRRRLEIARFHLATVAPGDDLSDDPVAEEEVNAALESVFFKLLREGFEASPPVESLIRRLESAGVREGRESAARGLRVSPRWALGESPRLGVNLRLRHDGDAVWSRFIGGLREGLGDDGATSVMLQYEDGTRYFRLEQVLDHPAGERSISLKVRWLF